MTFPVHSIRKSVLDGLVWGVGGKAAVILGSFLVLVVTSRTLSASEFGVFAAATVFADLSWALATSAFGVALVQKKELSSDEAAAGLIAFAGVAVALGVVMAVGAGAFEALFRAPGLQPVLWAMAGAAAIKVMSGYYGAMLQRRLDLRYYQMTQNLPQLFGGCALTVVGALLGWGVWALVAGYALTAGLELVLTAVRARAAHRLPASLQAFSGLLHVGGATLLNRMGNFFATNIDRVIIGAALGPAALGLYTRAYSLMMVPVKLLGLAIQRTFLPVFSRLQEDEGRLGSALERVLAAQPVILIPAGVGLILAAPVLMPLVLGPGWSQAVLPAQILMGAVGARLGYVAPEMAAIAIGEAMGAARRQLVYGLLVVGAGLAGLPFSLPGVAAGVTLALACFYMLSIHRAIRRLNCSTKVIVAGHLRGAVLAGLALGAAGVALAGALVWVPPWLANWVGLAVYAAALAAILMLVPARFLGPLLDELRNGLFSTVLRLFPGKARGSQGSRP